MIDNDIRQKLETYAKLLETWQKKMNLVSPSTIPVMWERHFEDSLQLLPYIDQNVSRETFSPLKLIDLGSGAGFPGLVLAIARPKTLDVTLIESDLKKCLFLENVSRETFSPVRLLRSRIEAVKDLKADIVTARALASLDQLLNYAFPFLKEDSTCFFLKGKTADEEIQMAKKSWDFELEIFPSLTDSTGRILKISHLQRAGPHV